MNKRISGLHHGVSGVVTSVSCTHKILLFNQNYLHLKGIACCILNFTPFSLSMIIPVIIQVEIVYAYENYTPVQILLILYYDVMSFITFYDKMFFWIKLDAYLHTLGLSFGKKLSFLRACLCLASKGTTGLSCKCLTPQRCRKGVTIRTEISLFVC